MATFWGGGSVYGVRPRTERQVTLYTAHLRSPGKRPPLGPQSLDFLMLPWISKTSSANGEGHHTVGMHRSGMKGHLELHSGVLVGTKVLHAQDIQLHGLQTSTAFSIIKPQRPNPSRAQILGRGGNTICPHTTNLSGWRSPTYKTQVFWVLGLGLGSQEYGITVVKDTS